MTQCRTAKNWADQPDEVEWADVKLSLSASDGCVVEVRAADDGDPYRTPHLHRTFYVTRGDQDGSRTLIAHGADAMLAAISVAMSGSDEVSRGCSELEPAAA